MANRSRLDISGSRVRLRLASDERLVALVRRGVAAAFEALYDRHSRELLAFCIYMLGSRQDAEDALQATYASAYRALLSSRRSVALRPWLFTIARNECLTILRRRRPVVELNGELAVSGDPVRHSELREEMREMLEGLRRLPERQRTALVLAEVNDLSQSEIGAVLGVRAAQVKAYIYQARANLTSERQAREADCHEIREELSSARGAALLRGRLRRHVRACAGCREYVDAVSRQRRQFGALAPIVPALALKYRVIEQALGIVASDPDSYAGGAVVGTSAAAAAAAEIAGGGAKALVVKAAAAVVALGASAGVGVSMLDVPEAHRHRLHGGASSAVVAPVSLGGAVADVGSSVRKEGGGASGRGHGYSRRGQGGRASIQRGAGRERRPDADRERPGPGIGAGEAGELGGKARAEGEGEAIVRARGVSSSKGTLAENAERRRAARNERKRENEQQRVEREAAVGSGEGHMTEEERRMARKERPGGGSKTPKTEEELLQKREARRQRVEERKLQREEEAPETSP
ncbi:MAG TPA: sigma-70 family RNA polymerase sigma factor [Solirubrobacteraceae bacterium]